jgi:hypothetical protein
MRRLAQEQERRSVSNQEEKPVSQSDVLSSPGVGHNSPGAAATATATPAARQRICRVPECVTVLAARNKSGFCSRHFHRSEAQPGKNGHGSAPRNGHAVHVHDDAAAAKVRRPTNGHAIATATAAAQICRAPDCGTALDQRNRSGFCHAHFYLSRRKPNGHAAAKLSVKTNGHAIAKLAEIRGNGRAITKGNGSNRHSTPVTVPAVAASASEERLNSVLLSWPVDQKLKAINAWLTAAL